MYALLCVVSRRLWRVSVRLCGEVAVDAVFITIRVCIYSLHIGICLSCHNIYTRMKRVKLRRLELAGMWRARRFAVAEGSDCADYIFLWDVKLTNMNTFVSLKVTKKKITKKLSVPDRSNRPKRSEISCASLHADYNFYFARSARTQTSIGHYTHTSDIKRVWPHDVLRDHGATSPLDDCTRARASVCEARLPSARSERDRASSTRWKVERADVRGQCITACALVYWYWKWCAKYLGYLFVILEGLTIKLR